MLKYRKRFIKLKRKVVFLFKLRKWKLEKWCIRKNEEGQRWVWPTYNWKGCRNDDELTVHLAGHSVQCEVDQTKNPTVNSPYLIHSSRQRVVLGAVNNRHSTSLVSVFFSFPSRKAFWLKRMQRSRIPAASLCSMVERCQSMLICHLRWCGRTQYLKKCYSKTEQHTMIPCPHE